MLDGYTISFPAFHKKLVKLLTIPAFGAHLDDMVRQNLQKIGFISGL